MLGRKKFNKRLVLSLSKGFTLMEVLVVIALLGVIFSLSVFISLDTYRGSSFRNERDTLVGVLQEARSEAMNNICIGGTCTGQQYPTVCILPIPTTLYFKAPPMLPAIALMMMWLRLGRWYR